MTLSLWIFVVLLLIGWIEGYNILFMTPFTAPSHSSFFKPVIRELADRGHSITYWSGLRPQPPSSAHRTNRNSSSSISYDPTDNVRLLFSEQLSGRYNFDQHGIGWSTVDHPFLLFFTLSDRLAQTCSAMYRDPVFLHLKNSSMDEYDLIVVDAVMNDCVLPLIHFLDKPLVYMNVISPMPWLLDTLGTPLALDHFPVPGYDFTDRMNLWQRICNTLVGLMGYYYRNWFMAGTVDRVARRMLTSMDAEPLPSIVDIEQKYLSMLITNTHFSINYQLPINSAVVEAGGLHCLPSQPLPQDLEDFVNGAGDAGFIIVSFGSIVRGADMPPETRDLMLSALGRLKQRVIWKWEDERRMAESRVPLPSNIRIMPWIPQQDLLGHPKARLFITHGGLFSNQEAVYHGVPFIGLPVFIDQPINVRKAENDGYAIHLSWTTLTEQILYDAIQEMLNNPRYKEKVKNVSALMRDQLDRPLDRAVYSIEYVIRHNGAAHLRTAARELTLIQRGMLDVILVLTLSSLVLAAAIFLTCRWLAGKVLVKATNIFKVTTRTANERINKKEKVH